MEQQLYLPVNTSDRVTFETFIDTNNEQLLTSLKGILDPQFKSPFLFYIFGASGIGKSHLLMSLCQAANDAEQTAVYIDLHQNSQLTPDILSGLESTSLVCLDGIEHVALSDIWQEAIFNLINRVKDNQQTTIVLSGREPISSLSLTLADLSSRLSWGLSYGVEALDDEGKQQLIIERAKQRGMIVSTEIAKFLMHRYDRDTHSLMAILDTLDKKSLQEKRVLSKQFIKSALSI